jgi:YesN/AraC family two-component response regulator
MKVLLIDNEIPIREALKKLIANYCPMVTSLDEANGVNEGILKISSFEPDILFF